MTLQSIVNSLYSLYSEAKVVHWNYEAENFAASHALSKDIYEFAEGAADTVAERMRFLNQNPFVEVKERHFDALRDLLGELESCTKDLYEFMKTLDTKTGVNKTTENMLLTITEQLEKFTWLLKSHLV